MSTPEDFTGRWTRPARLGAAALIAGALLAGCQSQPVRDPDFAAVRPPIPRAANTSSGSLYSSSHSAALFQDLTARGVGDILTVKLVEKTDASKSSETSAAKSTSTTIANPTVLGANVQFDAMSGLPLDSTRNNTLATSLSSSNAFDGSGESTQSNALSGEITVTVAEVLPNGNLVVQGEKLLTLNQGHEFVRFSGTIRPFDIDAANSVSSTKVADARIIYAGEGAQNDANAIGWVSRFFISALFPF